jgi:integrase
MLTSKGIFEGKRKLSAQSVTHAYRVLRKALNDAVQWGFLGKNPCDGVTPPRVPIPNRRAFTAQEAALLLKHCTGKMEYMYMPVLLAVTTGMRRGEVMALRWSDIDWVRGLAYVRRSAEETSGGVRYKEPKTRSSRRPAAIPQQVMDMLIERHRQARHEEELICSIDVRPDRLSDNFRYLCDRAKLPRLPFHALRHTYVSLAAAEGVSVKEIQEQVGHSTVALTLDTYTHLFPLAANGAAQAIGKAFAGMLPCKSDCQSHLANEPDN